MSDSPPSRPRRGPRVTAPRSDTIPESIKERFGARLREMRVAKGLTQQDVANATGLKHTYVSRVEVAEVNPTLETAEKLAAAVGVTLAELLKDV